MTENCPRPAGMSTPANGARRLSGSTQPDFLQCRYCSVRCHRKHRKSKFRCSVLRFYSHEKDLITVGKLDPASFNAQGNTACNKCLLRLGTVWSACRPKRPAEDGGLPPTPPLSTQSHQPKKRRSQSRDEGLFEDQAKLSRHEFLCRGNPTRPYVPQCESWVDIKPTSRTDWAYVSVAEYQALAIGAAKGARGDRTKSPCGDSDCDSDIITLKRSTVIQGRIVVDLGCRKCGGTFHLESGDGRYAEADPRPTERDHSEGVRVHGDK